MKLKIILLLFISLSIGISFYYFNTLSENKQKSIELSFKAKDSTNELIIKTLIMKSSIEKYLITGNEEDLLVYMKHTADTNNMFQKLFNTLSNTNQKNKIYSAKIALDIWKEEHIAKEINSRKKISKSKYAMTDVIDEINKKEGKGYFDIFRKKLVNFINTEEILLKDRQEKYYELLKSSDKVSSKLVEENVKLVKHTNEVIIKANQLLIYAIDMETGMRGYLITGNDDFLEPYNLGYNNFFETIKHLSQKVSDNKAQVSQLKTINTHMKEWNKRIVKKSIKLRRDVGDLKSIDRIIKMASSNNGEKLFNEYKSQMDAFISNLNK